MPRTALRAERLEDRTAPSFGFDPSFGEAGRVALSPRTGTVPAVAVQADGGILTTATSAEPPGLIDEFFVTTELIRLRPDGTRDTAFGDGTSTLLPTARGVRVAVGPDGRIYAAATTGDSFIDGNSSVTVYCFHPDGTRDTTFGVRGEKTFNFPGTPASTNSGVGGLAVQPDGKLIVVGSDGLGVVSGDGSPTGGIGMVFIPSGFAVARLNPDGSPDATFDGDGFLRYSFDPDLRFGSINDVAIGADGKVLVAGGVRPLGEPLTHRAAVVRFNPDGSADAVFDGDGLWVGGDDTVSSEVIPLPDGRVLVAGIAGEDVSVVRLTSAGEIDGSFGTGGWTAVNPQLPFGSAEAALLPDGRIVVVSVADAVGRGSRVTAAILSADGDRLSAFGGGELFDIDYESATPGVSAVAVSPDGRIVTASILYRGEGAQTTTSMGVAVLAGDSHLLPPTTHAALLLANRERVATADVNADGTPDTITVTAPGEPIRVTVLSGKDGTTVLIPAFDPFGGDFTGGGFVVAADLDGDGYAEFVVSPDQGGGPRVAVLSMIQFKAPESTDVVWRRANFFALDDASFRGGVRLALGDVNGDGVPDLAVTAGFLGGPRVALFDGNSLTTTPMRLVADFFAFPGADAESLRNGAYVSLGDVDGDGHADFVLGGGPGGAARVYILDGATVAAGDVAGAHANPLANFFVAGNSTDRAGVRVSAGDTDGDGRADVVASYGEARLRVYRGKDIGGAGEPTRFEDIDLTLATTGVFVS